MATVKFVLRYNTEQQKKKLQAIAKKCGRSANAHILQLIDSNIEYVKNGGIMYEGNQIPSYSVTRQIPIQAERSKK